MLFAAVARLETILTLNLATFMLREYTETKGIVTDLIKALPGNGSVNTSQHATIEEKLVFHMVWAKQL
jgi:hypothetical protein